MASANHSRSRCPSICLAMEAPATDPTSPAPPKTRAQGHLTRPAFAWLSRLTVAFMATAAAEVPIATCGSRMPTT